MKNPDMSLKKWSIYHEHKFETAFVVRCASLEGVARGGEEVDGGTGEVVDQV